MERDLCVQSELSFAGLAMELDELKLELLEQCGLCSTLQGGRTHTLRTHTVHHSFRAFPQLAQGGTQRCTRRVHLLHLYSDE